MSIKVTLTEGQFANFVQSLIDFDEISHYAPGVKKIMRHPDAIREEMSWVLEGAGVKAYTRKQLPENVASRYGCRPDRMFKISGSEYYIFCYIEILEENDEYVVALGRVYKKNLDSGDTWDPDYHDILVG